MRRGGRTERVGRLDPAWLAPDSGVFAWVDIQRPDDDDARVLRETFGFHALAVEDALQTRHLPKLESYGAYLYLVLHGINFQAEEHCFDTHDTDFFVGPTYLVTVHDGGRRSMAQVSDACEKNDVVMSEGPVALMHRIIDTMVDHYRPEVDKLESRLDAIEERVLAGGEDDLTGDILAVKRDIASLRRVVIPQRDVVGRLARREFDIISQEMAYRFRDVHDQFVRMTDEATIFQDRVTSLLDAHLAAISNRLAQASKLIAVVATLFGPLTVVTGLWGMNIPIPEFPGGEDVQFWWVLGMMSGMSLVMYWIFKRAKWM
ncbi:MAG: magnesium transporter CorA family protein [Vicinamibacterales bacterium]